MQALDSAGHKVYVAHAENQFAIALLSWCYFKTFVFEAEDTHGILNLQSTTANGRRLLQPSYPAVDLILNITTSAEQAQNQSAMLVAASNQTYALASNIGAQGDLNELLCGNPE